MKNQKNQKKSESKEKWLLIRTDGYDILTFHFDDYCKTFEEMEKQYESFKPKDWFENEKEMSHMSDIDAILYENGNNVYVWKIVKA